MTAFMSDEAKAALTAAVKAVEARTSAELVIAVRGQSGSYLHADLLAGSIASIVVLACLLYLPVDFGLHSFLIDPIVAGVVFGLLSSRVPGLRRALTPASRRDAQVEEGAHAAFFRRGIRRTSASIGVLVYISVLERRVEVLADDGVAAAVPEAEWARAVEAIAAELRAGADGVRVARIIEGLAEVLEPCLPRSEDDVNELPDEVEG